MAEADSAASRAAIIVSLDGHMEVTPGCLEPLLDRMKDNKKLVTYSAIRWINHTTFEAYYDANRWVTGFGFE